MVFIISILLTINSCWAETSTVKGWRGIVPLHSTRADVEALLGPGTNECKCRYFMEKENVFFIYSSGDCKTGGSWDVAKDTVLSITVYQKPSPRFSEMNLDKTKFSEKHVGHIEDIVSYVNDEEGLIIEVNSERDMVLGFYYMPTKRDQHLRCRK